MDHIKKDMKNKLDLLVEKLGKIPIKKEFQEEYGKTYNKYIIRYYKKWGTFVEACGYRPRFKKYNEDDICIVPNCNRKPSSMDLCKMHYNQYRRNGKILKRTRLDPNKIIDKGNYIEVWTHDINNKRNKNILLDKKFLNKIKGYSVGYTKQDGAYINIGIEQHRLVIYIFGELYDNLVYTYKNRNKWDLRQENIEIVNRSELKRRNKMQCNNTSGYVGITKTKEGRYLARIGHQGKQIHLGSSFELSEALEMRKNGEIQYWKK